MQVNIFNPASGETNALTMGLNIWAAVGPLLGIFVGSYLTRSAQRRQWLADEKVKEWRELLGTLTTSFTTIVQFSTGGKTSAEDLTAHIAAGEVLGNRIFIAEEVRQLKIHDKWREAVGTFEQDRNPTTFGTNFGRDVRHQIERGAKQAISNV
jgi:hypothetical protein